MVYACPLKITLSVLILFSLSACASTPTRTFANNATSFISPPCDNVCKLILPDGSVYEGEFENGLFNGKGILVRKNGNKFDGRFQDGQMHGQGNFSMANGDTYVGSFVNGAMDGEGVYLAANGSKYTGDFKQGHFDGVGVLTKANKDRYVGEFKNNQLHGEGIYYLSNPKGGKKKLVGTWKNGRYVNTQQSNANRQEIMPLNGEEVLFYQHEIVSSSTKQIEASRPGVTDLYFISFGGDGHQDVFMNEALYTKELFEKQFGMENRTLSLINNRKAVNKVPIASVTNLKIALHLFAQRMDVEEDILFLYLTSHGSKEHTLNVNLIGVPLHDLSAKALEEILQESGIKWRVIVISACYSGGFIEHLKNDYTMVITSAKADRTSFGCSDDAEMTFFGRAFFQKSLDQSSSFSNAFVKAKELVTVWEEEKDFYHSEPQIYSSPLIEEKLKEWRETLEHQNADLTR